MIEVLKNFDQSLFFVLNGLHAPWLDTVMFSLSKSIASIPVYLIIVYLIVKRFRKDSWIVFTCIGICILLSDQITSGFMKPFFERLRPTHEPSLDGLVHIVNGYKGGKYGFASSHSANTFGIAMFCLLLFKPYYKWMAWLFVWATLISYTRIYLGVHYPGDILVGALIGIGCGYLSFTLLKLLFKKLKHKELVEA